MKRITTSIFLIIFINLLSAQQFQNSDNDIILENADNLVGSNLTDASFREFMGNVVFSHKNIRAKCDFAKQFLTENRADMRGNVIITQSTMTLKSPKIAYYGNTGIAYADDSVSILDRGTFLRAEQGIYDSRSLVADFYGNVFIDDDSARIYANHIIYERKSRNSFAYGDVRIFGKQTNVVLTADTVFSITEENYSKAVSNPILFQIDTVVTYHDTSVKKLPEIRFDTLTISSDTMQAYRTPGNEFYQFTGKVEIVRGGVAAKSSEAVYFKNAELFILRNMPVVWYDNTQLYADSIVIFMKNNELKEIRAFNNANAVSQNDTSDNSRKNQISGNDILIKIDSSKISRIESYKDAKSLYYFTDEKGSNGVDRKSTDTIKVVFESGEVNKIYWLGMTVSEFFPENLVFNEPSAYNLPAYKWNNDKPKKKSIKK